MKVKGLVVGVLLTLGIFGSSKAADIYAFADCMIYGTGMVLGAYAKGIDNHQPPNAVIGSCRLLATSFLANLPEDKDNEVWQFFLKRTYMQYNLLIKGCVDGYYSPNIPPVKTDDDVKKGMIAVKDACANMYLNK